MEHDEKTMEKLPKSMIAYFNAKTKWADCIGVKHDRGNASLVYRAWDGRRFGPPVKIAPDLPGYVAFHQKYRMIMAEDFCEERERLIDILRSQGLWK